MQEECSICTWQFSREFKTPILLCAKQHFCCNHCYFAICQKRQPFNCPQCRQHVKINKCEIYYPFKKLQKIIMKENENRERDYLNIKKQRLSLLEALLQFEVAQENTDVNAYLRNKARDLMMNGYFEEAGKLLMKLIESNIKVAEEQPFLGLGSVEEEKGFCQNKGYDWYENYYGDISLYDQLAICFLKSPNFNAQKKWYEKLLVKVPNSFKALFCLAVTEHNADHEKAAFNLYEKVVQLNPQFPKSYLMMAFQERLIHKNESSLQYARECQKRQPGNVHAQYIIKSIKQSEYTKQFQKQMHKIFEANPIFVRPLYEVAIYLQQADKKRAKDIIKTIELINEDYVDAPLLHGRIQMKLSGHELGAEPISKILSKGLISNKYKSLAFEIIADEALQKKKYQDAYKFIKLAIENQPNNLNSISILVNINFLRKDYNKVIEQSSIVLSSDLQNKYSDSRRQMFVQSYKKIFQGFIFVSYYHLKNYKEALEYLKESSYKISMKSRLNFYVAVCYKQTNKYKHALKWFNLCVQRQINEETAFENIISILNEQKRFTQAVKRVEQYKSQHPFQLKKAIKLSELNRDILEKMEQQQIVILQ